LTIALLILHAGSAGAQTATARIEGLVTDNSRAALPGVTVTATNVGTNASRVDVTDTRGSYTITALPVGDYQVRVELTGFKPEVAPITLTVSQVARMDFRLLVGGVSETVTVTAAAPLIEKATSEISTLIDEKQIENLPLNGRNFTQLATLSPGVNRGVPGSNSSGGGSGTDAETFRYSEFGGQFDRLPAPARRYPGVFGDHEQRSGRIRPWGRCRSEPRDQERHQPVQRQRLRFLSSEESGRHAEVCADEACLQQQ
jgi:hypothetical protein